MPKLIRPPDSRDETTFLRILFLKTEQRLISEIKRKRSQGYVDYAEAAALQRTQQILQEMVDESWSYTPIMIEKIFYRSEAAANGYRNAAGLTSIQLGVVQQLSNNLLGEIMEASATAQKSIEEAFLVGRQEAGKLREEALKAVASEKAAGYGARRAASSMVNHLENEGITAFIDKRGRKWNLQDYCNMAARTTARQAEVAAILTADPDHDLYKIVKIGSTCPVCAPLEGRIYSWSGTNPDYPPLSAAFGKIDPGGGDDLSNTYLNIHPNCLHSMVKYTTIGKTEEQIQKDKDFSSFKKNPVTVDPRTKKQIEAYKEKVRNRQRLLRDMKQHQEYRRVLGNGVPKDFDKFRELKYNKSEAFEEIRQQALNKKKAAGFLQQLDRGEINTTVRAVKQQEHILGTRKWKQRVKNDLVSKGTAPDMFERDVDIQALMDQYKGTGTVSYRKGQEYPIEYITADHVIGKYFNLGTGKYETTKRFAIRYASKGVHLHPVKEM